MSTQVDSLLDIITRQEIAERVRKYDLQRTTLLQQIAKEKQQVEGLTKRYEAVAEMLEQAHKVKSQKEGEHLRILQPMIDVLYSRLSPHPYFGTPQVVIRDGKRSVAVSLDETDGEVAPAVGYFSEAQRRAVALCIFLSSALQQGWTRFGPICIDDPVQHMDDMNTYAFLDLMQGIVLEGRQVVITTASERLYKTMLQRFQNWNTGGKQRFQGFRLEGVTPDGPDIIEDTD